MQQLDWKRLYDELLEASGSKGGYGKSSGGGCGHSKDSSPYSGKGGKVDEEPLEKKYKELEKKHQELEKEYKELEKKYMEIEKRKVYEEPLQKKHQELEKKYKELEKKHQESWWRCASRSATRLP